MAKALCNTEDYTGFESHFEHMSSFDYMHVGNKTMWICEDCRLEIERLNEEEDGQAS